MMRPQWFQISKTWKSCMSASVSDDRCKSQLRTDERSVQGQTTYLARFPAAECASDNCCDDAIRRMRWHWDGFTRVRREQLRVGRAKFTFAVDPLSQDSVPPSLSFQPKSHAGLLRTTLGYPDFFGPAMKGTHNTGLRKLRFGIYNNSMHSLT